ncbi:hypothetical protein ACFLZJ_00510 [Nanoarchaeota archaeon]
MKKLMLLLIVFLVFPTVLAINLNVEKMSENEVLITDLNLPAVFDLKVTNNGPTDNLEFYNLLGFSMFPIGTVPIDSGQVKAVELKVAPLGDFDFVGTYKFDYIIRSQDGSEQVEDIAFRVIKLEHAFEVGSGEVDPESNSLEIYIYNKVSFNFEAVNAKFSSVFFDFEEDFALGPNERKSFIVQLDKNEFKKLMAGFYTLNAKATVGDTTTNVEGTIKFIEKDIVTTTTKDYGFVISTKLIEKTNEGNVLTQSQTVLKKNIISRLFTTLSPEPDSVDREGLLIYYTWDREIKPGETLEIKMRTNWLFPLLIIILVVVIVILAKQYMKTNLSVKKRVAFVRAKGGEFALKVSIFVKAKRYVERISIIDRLPPLVKLYEKFGNEKPLRINETTKRIEWGYEKLEEGETRLITYIIYSKVGILGKFALPKTTAIYERDGEIHETESNKAFFVAEQRTKDLKE